MVLPRPVFFRVQRVIEMHVSTSSSSSYHGSTQLEQELPFEFTADNKEYWLLEIKNILLTVVTFGIYGAWASVKRRQYLAQHTFLDGANFDYTADPKVILRSRIVMFGVFAVVSASRFISEGLYSLCMFLLMLCMPWAVLSSFAFHAKNTTYRGARFSFHAKTIDAYIWYFKLCALYFFTFGLALPLVLRSVASFSTKHHRIGGVPFEFNDDTKPFWKITVSFFLKMLGCFVGFGAVSALSSFTRSSGDPSVILGLIFGVLTLVAMVAIFWVVFTTLAGVVNLIFGQVSFGPHRLEANQEGMGLFRLMLTNYLLVIFTLGLGYPIAILRMRRYRYDHLKVLAKGPIMQGVSLDPVGGSRGGSDAVGAAMLDIGGGFDFGL